VRNRHPVSTMIGGGILAAWIPFWNFVSTLSTIDLMRTAGGHPSIGTFFLPRGIADGLTVLGIGVMIRAFITQARTNRQLPASSDLSAQIGVISGSAEWRAAASSAASIPAEPHPQLVPRAPVELGPASRQETLGSFSADVAVIRCQITVGDFIELELRPSDKIRIEVREICQNTGKREALEEEHGAVLNISVGGGLVFGGERSIKISTNCYYVPVSSNTNKEPYSMYAQYFTRQSSHVFAAYLEHVNLRSGVATIMTCRMSGLAKL